MWLSRRFLAFCVCLTLAACGFEPVNAPGGTGATLKNAVLVDEPTNRDAFLLVRRLEERFGRSDVPSYRLSYNLSISVTGLGIDSVGNTNRFNVLGTAGYVLADATTGEAVTSGTVNSFTAYSTTDSTVSTLASERDARERLMVILADQIIARVLAVDLTP